MKTSVIGLGKIGLPLAVQFAKKGRQVIGLDNSLNVVRLINNGQEPFPGEFNLGNLLLEVMENGNLSATTDVKKAVEESENIVVCIPLVVNAEAQPEFENMDLLVLEIGKYLKKGTLISFETTLPVGTTRSRFTAILEQESRMKVGVDFFVVFSPERVLTGRIFSDLRKYPKLVGGVTKACTRKGVQFYETVLDFDERPDLRRANGVWHLDSCESAEFAKIAETTYRDVNIGLANEFALFAQDISVDIGEVIEASNSQPFSHIHSPGISVGGHCIPVYPQFYTWGNPNAEIVKAARRANAQMPIAAVGQIKNKLGPIRDRSIGILGLTYRPGVKETAFTGAKVLKEELEMLGARVFILDPFYSPSELTDLGYEPLTDFDKVDGLILHTAHSEFLALKHTDFPNLRFIFDGRNFFTNWSKIQNITYLHV